MGLSLQFVGRHDEESLVLPAGYAYEQATEWHKRQPTLEGIATAGRESVIRNGETEMGRNEEQEKGIFLLRFIVSPLPHLDFQAPLFSSLS